MKIKNPMLMAVLAVAVQSLPSWGDESQTRHLTQKECGIAGQVAFAASLVRDHGGDELAEHAKIDANMANYPRQELWLVTHDVTAFAYQHPDLNPTQVGSIVVHQCEGSGGDLRFAAQDGT